LHKLTQKKFAGKMGSKSIDYNDTMTMPSNSTACSIKIQPASDRVYKTSGGKN